MFSILSRFRDFFCGPGDGLSWRALHAPLQRAWVVLLLDVAFCEHRLGPAGPAAGQEGARWQSRTCPAAGVAQRVNGAASRRRTPVAERASPEAADGSEPQDPAGRPRGC